MTIRCVIKGCPNIYKKGCGIHFFSFPVKKPQQLKRWIMATGLSNWQPSTASRVCSLHFKPLDFVDTPYTTQKVLKTDVIPTINVAYYIEEVAIDPLNDLQKAIEMQEKCTRLDNVETVQAHNDVQSNFVMTETSTNVNIRKRKICECEAYLVKIRKLEEENKKLQKLHLDQIDEHNKELEKQQEIFQVLLNKEKKEMKKRLNASNLKCKLLIRKKNRREEKITNMSNLLTTLKKKTIN
ncbi:THAP domain-containing protein 1 [Monomorium pharaonis]|uniref:THAP domain-containing protein 1 n=1 Tax=Monomorium pharaonis TaxID=307658 RepID=UPI00102E1EF5|nr:THAP domain-containing protein 1 [Monomorium pharaonis]